MFSLIDKKILITGASSGIGRQLAISIAKFGGRLVCVGRDENRLEETVSLLVGEGHSFKAFDITSQLQSKKFVDECESYDGIVFNAGIIDYTPIKFINDEKLLRIFDVNFNSVVRLNQKLVKEKRLNKGGSLIFISSISSILGVQGTGLYASSKAALKAYAKVVASELAPQKIRANSISPGIVVTSMTHEAVNAISATEVDKAEREYPLGYGKPEDIAGLVVYLLSDASRWMTGSDLIIDGGLTLR